MKTALVFCLLFVACGPDLELPDRPEYDAGAPVVLEPVDAGAPIDPIAWCAALCPASSKASVTSSGACRCSL